MDTESTLAEDPEQPLLTSFMASEENSATWFPFVSAGHGVRVSPGMTTFVGSEDEEDG